MYKLVILDLDHCVRRPLSGKIFSDGPNDQEPINQHLYDLHPEAKFVGLSNQGGVAAGYRTLDETINESLVTLLNQPKLSSIWFCPDYEGRTLVVVYPNGFTFIISGDGGFRKPDCGGIKEILVQTSITDKNKVIMYGDRQEDRQAAHAAGIDFTLIS